jgi:hypothetical protein
MGNIYGIVNIKMLTKLRVENTKSKTSFQLNDLVLYLLIHTIIEPITAYVRYKYTNNAPTI